MPHVLPNLPDTHPHPGWGGGPHLRAEKSSPRRLLTRSPRTRRFSSSAHAGRFWGRESSQPCSHR